MSIQVFAGEIIDGLGDMVAKANSIAYTTSITHVKKENALIDDLENLIKKDKLALANFRPAQKDLYYLYSILASTGWNKNDDIFIPEETWAARKTAEDKRFNFMHTEDDIIGHITSNEVVDWNGNLLPDDLMVPPEQFEIMTGAVIYTSWQNPEMQERINKIIEGIENNEWCVSMECLFNNFDYALSDESGAISIVPRSEATAYLTKNLRVYGGSGVINNYKIGRILKNITFSGKGLVDKPANPRSIILKENDEALSTSAIKENDMTVTDLNTQIKELTEQLEAAQAQVEQLSSFKTKADTLEVTLTEKDTLIATANTEIETLKVSVSKLEESLAAVNAEKTSVAAELATMQKTVKTDRRKSALLDAGVEAAEMEETVASFDAVDDVAFDRMVSLMKKNKVVATKVEETKADEAEGEEEVLEDVEEESTAKVTETEADVVDEKSDLRASAIQWFETLLTNTKKV